VGAQLVAGSPLGIAGGSTGPGGATVTLELRRDGVPVNPLEFARPQ
jgi:septal ring factor EnvC (AmiA/AmiB activator)